jgi:hypothetical protein
MDSVAMLANIAEIVGAIIVVGGLFFAVLQLRQFRQQQRERAAIELFRFYGNPDFTEAFNRMMHMADNMTAKDMRGDENGLEDAAMLISSTMENIGVMTHQRIVPFTVVNHLIGANAIILWNKLRLWAHTVREETDSDYMFEWFQGLGAAAFVEGKIVVTGTRTRWYFRPSDTGKSRGESVRS